MPPQIKAKIADKTKRDTIAKLLELVVARGAFEPVSFIAMLRETVDVDVPEHRRAVARLVAKYLTALFVSSARKRARLSQRQLADELGITAGYIAEIERRHFDTKVPLDFLVQVSLVTNTPLNVTQTVHVQELEQENENLKLLLADALVENTRLKRKTRS